MQRYKLPRSELCAQRGVHFMNSITLRVLEGADRGKVFQTDSIPITIGREEGNSIQLNDERISRFHTKIQLDHSDLVLTDLESTNGTKVNGEEIQLRILRHGDVISVGRSTILYGSREEINRRMERLSDGELDLSSSESADLAIQKRSKKIPTTNSLCWIWTRPKCPNACLPVKLLSYQKFWNTCMFICGA